MTAVRCPVNEGAQISRDEPALILEDGKITFSEAECFVAGARARLARAGCQAGERVALCAGGEPWQTVVLLMALLRLRAVTCLLAGGVDDAGDQALADCHRLIGGPGSEAGQSAESLIPRYYEGQDTAEDSMLMLDQPATILFERGPEGKRRGLLHWYGHHYYGARGANHAVRLSSRNRWLATAPLHEAAGLSALFRCLIGGAALVLPPPNAPLEEMLARFQVTHVSLLPEELDRWLVKGAGRSLSHLRAVQVDGGGEYPALLQRARAAGLPVYPGFGISEVASGISSTQFDTPAAHRQGAGAVLRYREVRITEEGTIWVRGQALFAGYVENHGVRRPVDKDGWLCTGRRGRWEAEGYLQVRPRDPRETQPWS